MNRKLIRPDMTAARDAAASGRKKPPADNTAAEAYYYKKQMEAKTPVVISLVDGETVRGVIEWYDAACVKLHRKGAPNLLIFKHAIRYMHKEGDTGSLE